MFTGGEQTLFLDRERELEGLGSALASAREGRGQLIIARGPAGIGKTRLLTTFCAGAGEAGNRCLTARGHEFEREFPFSLVRQLFTPVTFDQQLADAAFSGAAGIARQIITPDLDQDYSEIDADYGALHGLYWVTANLSELGPLILMVDDYHWADPQSARFIHFLAERIGELPVLLLLGVRSGEQTEIDEPAPEPVGPAVIIEPRPLGTEATGEVIGAVTDSRISTDLADACHEATGGNPFLIEALARELEGLGELSAEAVRRATSGPVADSVVRRTRRLGDEAARTAELLAVLGSDIDRTLIAELAGLSPEGVEKALGSLRDAHLLSRGEGADSAGSDFVHPLVRRSLFENVGAEQRRDLHARAAALMADSGAEPELIAHHLMHGTPERSEWAVEALCSAARNAEGRGAPGAAAQMLERALELNPGEDVALLLDLGAACSTTGDDRAIEFFRRARELATDPIQKARAAAELGLALIFTNRGEEAIPVLREALATGPPPPIAARLRSLLLICGAYTPPMRRAVQEDLAEALEGVGVDDEVPPTTFGATAMEAVISTGTAEQGRALGRAAFDRGLLDQLGPVMPPVYITATSLFICDDFERAGVELENAIDEARRRGSQLGFALGSGFRAWLRYRLGDLYEAQADAEAALSRRHAGGLVEVIRPAVAAALVEVLLARGKLPAARRVLEEHPVAEEDAEATLGQQLRAAHCSVAMAEREPAAALEAAQRIAEWERAWGDGTGAWVQWRRRAALAHHALGHDSEAVELASEQVRLAREFGAPRGLGMALTAAGVVAPDPEAGIARLEGAVEVLSGGPAKLEEARAQLQLGLRLAGAGERSRAGESLLRARELAATCGAARVAHRAAEAIAVVGTEPQATAQARGPADRDRLTPAELRVARLAGDGLTNREIAQELYVTTRTVEAQLSSCYSKLSVNSREELTSAVSE